jgi:YbbR domain-containing protein
VRQAGTESDSRHKPLLFLMSLIVAIALWINAKAASSTEEAYPLPVSARGLDENLIVVSDLGEVTVKAQGTQEDIENINLKNVKPFIDLRRAEQGKNTYDVQLETRGNPINISWKILRPTVEVDIQPRVSEPRPVDVDIIGTPPPGWIVPNATASPSSVRVDGPRSAVAKVAKVRAVFDLDNAQQGEALRIDLQLLDATGARITSGATATPAWVEVTPNMVPAAATKFVIVQPTWKGTLPIGFKLLGATVAPPQISVTGELDLLTKVTAVETEPIDLSKITADVTVRVKVKLPRGITPVKDNTVNVMLRVQPVPPPNAQPDNSEKPPPQ